MRKILPLPKSGSTDAATNAVSALELDLIAQAIAVVQQHACAVLLG